MRILGIESSCDETAIAVVSGEGERLVVERNLVASQALVHAKYGGVVPEVAAREHVDALFPLLLEAGVARDGEGIDAVAVTSGPGLIPALRIGVELGKTLAWLWKKPLVGVNHLEGHVYSVWLGEEGSQGPEFPALCLLVSGGHTELLLMHDHGVYEKLGQTRDDAAGEAFDKAAKVLGLGYPGGPVISKLAQSGKRDAIAFPRPMLDSGDLDFSYSGLKTAVAVRRREFPSDKIEDVCASFEEAIVDSLVAKTIAAVEQYQPTSVILAGGVSANLRLREVLLERLSKAATPQLFTPDLKYTGDNAAMIAAAGYFRARAGEFVDPLTLEADPNKKLCP
jgi:N6-L-threonylcarbamoyladenine synthase